MRILGGLLIGMGAGFQHRDPARRVGAQCLDFINPHIHFRVIHTDKLSWVVVVVYLEHSIGMASRDLEIVSLLAKLLQHLEHPFARRR